MIITKEAQTARECVCHECRQQKPHTEEYFNHNRALKYGLKRVCRQCERELRRKGGRYYSSLYRKGPFTRRTGVHYSCSLPAEKHGEMLDYLKSLSHYANLAYGQGLKPDVGAFTAEYVGQRRGCKPCQG